MLSVRCPVLSCPVCLSVTFVHCGQTLGRIKMKLGTKVRLGPSHIVLDGDPAPPPPKGHSSPQFTAHICCGQMAAWIKMSLGMELGLAPGDFVLDGEYAPPQGGGQPKIFGHVYCGQTAVCIRIPLGVQVGLSPCNIVLDWDPASLPIKGHSSPPPIFSLCPLWQNGWMD